MFLKKRWLLVLWFYYGIRFSRSNLSESLLSPVQRRIRELSYPDESEMGIFFALAIPLDDPISTKAISVAFFFEANYQLTNSPVGNNENNQSEESSRRKKKSIGTNKRGIDRRTIYFILESKFESLGFPGKACLLRSICETCRNPLHYHNGLLGDLLRILFTPSSSLDENLPHEYRNAENQLDAPHNCSVTYSLCPFNIYDYITTRVFPLLYLWADRFSCEKPFDPAPFGDYR